MPANKSTHPIEDAGREASRQKHLGFECENVLHNLAINPRVSIAMALQPHLCTSCWQSLQELLTTVGLKK